MHAWKRRKVISIKDVSTTLVVSSKVLIVCVESYTWTPSPLLAIHMTHGSSMVCDTWIKLWSRALRVKG